MDLKNIVIPPDVVDEAEYKKMILLQRHPVMHNTTYLSSNGDEINIAMLPHFLEKAIAHLSSKEQEQVREMKRQWNQIRAKISTAKSKAYGTAGMYGGKNKSQIARYQLEPLEHDVIELLGRMFTVPEVVRIMSEENGLEVSDEDVKKILKKHLAEIEKKRDEFRNKVTDVRLYNKRPRLEELSWMYSKMKARYIALNSSDAYNAMLRTLEQIRKEAEGDIVTINETVDINVELTIQKHIQEEIYKTINLKEIILSRVASRMNYDPHKLIAGLHNSYYAKFVQISGDFDENAEMKYPSNTAYDFTKIEKTAEKSALVMTQDKPTEPEHSTAVNIRELFLNKVRKQTKDIETRALSNSIVDVESVTEKEKPIKRGRGRSKDKNVK